MTHHHHPSPITHHPSSPPTHPPAVGGLPKCPDTCVDEVESALRAAMERQALGTPIHPDRTVASVFAAISSYHGAEIEGDSDRAYGAAVKAVDEMIAASKRDLKAKNRDMMTVPRKPSIVEGTHKGKSRLPADNAGPWLPVLTLTLTLVLVLTRF